MGPAWSNKSDGVYLLRPVAVCGMIFYVRPVTTQTGITCEVLYSLRGEFLEEARRDLVTDAVKERPALGSGHDEDQRVPVGKPSFY